MKIPKISSKTQERMPTVKTIESHKNIEKLEYYEYREKS